LRCIEVTAPSHLHVGNIDLAGSLGRLYGTLGFTLSSPRFRAVICESNNNEVFGSGREDISYYLNIISKIFNIKLSVNVLEEIPAHVGMGSTTAMALSIAHAASILSSSNYNLPSIAVKIGRSRISGLGLYSYMYGGFLIDGGYRLDKQSPPPLIFQRKIPGDLKIVYAIPSKPLPKILEIKSREDEILSKLPPMTREKALENSHLVLMGIIPSAVEGDWKLFGEYLTRLNRGLGEYWAIKQEGIYCCKESEEIINYFLDRGGLCACQSSWGPTVYTLVNSHKVDQLLDGLNSLLSQMGGGTIGVTSINNWGAKIRVQEE